MTLKDLAVKHDYYCHTSNYYSDESRSVFENFEDFIAEWHDADVDMNLVFRWDIKDYEENENYCAHIFTIQQRKGIFHPITIKSIEEKDVPKFIAFLQPHIEKLNKIWQPLHQ